MKALIQTGSSLSACGHAQAGGRVPVPLKSDFLSIVIETLENEDYKNVLALRYISCLTWGEICGKLYISLSTVKRWHQNALELIKIEQRS
jgi:DNA-directed RNA polymerase specialized sigma24 family protein